MRSAILLVLLGCGSAPCPEVEAAPEVPSEPVRLPPPRASAPDGFVEVLPQGVMPSGDGFALILREERSGRVVPVMIGGTEAMTIELRLEGRRYERPLTHDLLDRMLGILGGQVVMVQVNKVRHDVFIGTIVLWDGHEQYNVDARTSDAVAVALGHRVPIYVSEAVFADQSFGAEEPLLP
jgi:bifunctional DNase/RNase